MRLMFGNTLKTAAKAIQIMYLIAEQEQMANDA